MGEGGGGEEKGRFLSFNSLHFSLPFFPFSPETPDTQANRVFFRASHDIGPTDPDLGSSDTGNKLRKLRSSNLFPFFFFSFPRTLSCKSAFPVLHFSNIPYILCLLAEKGFQGKKVEENYSSLSSLSKYKEQT